jgi:hypothetical protein
VNDLAELLYAVAVGWWVVGFWLGVASIPIMVIWVIWQTWWVEPRRYPLPKRPRRLHEERGEPGDPEPEDEQRR